jgi:hypothetical protein
MLRFFNARFAPLDAPLGAPSRRPGDRAGDEVLTARPERTPA